MIHQTIRVYHSTVLIKVPVPKTLVVHPQCSIFDSTFYVPQHYGSHRRQRRFLRYYFVPTLPHHTILAVAVVAAVVAAAEVTSLSR